MNSELRTHEWYGGYAGHIMLAEDTTGQGHISRAMGDKDRVSLFLPLAAQ